MTPKSHLDEYRTWKSMRERCYKPSHRSYHNYGGRGVVMCDDWRDDFDQFFEDMGRKPAGTQLVRTDKSGPFSPENCQWVKPKQGERPAPPFEARPWGPWRLIAESEVLIHAGNGYEIDLLVCRNAAQVLRYIADVTGRDWSSDEEVAGLVRALDDVLEFRKNLTSSSGTAKRLTRARVEGRIRRIARWAPAAKIWPAQ